jgi:hypothetical protein
VATGRIGVTPTLRTRWSKQPTAGTTSLSGLDDNSVALVYDVGYEAVYRNGALLSRGNDYTATNGTTVTLIDATLAGDIIEILANQLVPLTDAISKGQFTAKGALLSATAASTPGVLAVGANDTVLTADSSTATGLKWATPAAGALSFTRRLSANSTWYFNSIAYNGTNLYVAAGQTGNLYTSPDGITWTSRTSGFGSNNIFKVSYGNGLWVAVGGNGTITTSTDGTTWTARTANMSTNTIRSVEYANSIWVAVGNGGGTTDTGGITYSTDGTTWTRKSQSITVGTTYYGVVWNGTNWIVAASNSTNNHLYASAPSGTWTAGADVSNAGLTGIWWDGTRHYVARGSTGTPGYSTSTTLGTTTDIYTFQIANSAQISNAYGIVYSGKFFTSNEIKLYSVTMDSTTYPAVSDSVQSPSTQNYITDPYVYSAGLALWYGAAGWIIGGQGQIWTSF